MKTLIVIATHNDTPCLERVVKDIHEFTQEEDFHILISDTCSSRPEHLKAVRELGRHPRHHIHFHTQKVYDAGAFLHAMRNYPGYGGYFFLQDVVAPVKHDWLEKFQSNAPVCAWEGIPFNDAYDSHEFCYKALGLQTREELPPVRRFQHNCFYATGKAIRSLLREPMPSCLCKQDQIGYQLMWPVMFDRLWVEMNYLKGYGLEKFTPKERKFLTK